MNSIPSYRPSPARKAPVQRQSKKWQTTNQRAKPRSRTLTTARKRKNSSKTSFSSASPSAATAAPTPPSDSPKKPGNNPAEKSLNAPTDKATAPWARKMHAPPRVSAHICSNKAELGTTKRPSNRPMGMEDARRTYRRTFAPTKPIWERQKDQATAPWARKIRAPRAYRRTFAPTKPNWERPKDQANALTRRTSAFFLFLSPRLPRRRCRSIRPSSAPMSFL